MRKLDKEYFVENFFIKVVYSINIFIYRILEKEKVREKEKENKKKDYLM